MEKWKEDKDRETPPQTPVIPRAENVGENVSDDDASGVILNMEMA